MPIDLSPAGLPSAYPAHGPRFWPWLAGWLLCCGIDAAVVLLLWPASTPARGAKFWLCLIGAPNAIFFVALAIARVVYEANYLYARFRNRHRAEWLHERIRSAQRPLQILGTGYCLPLGGKSLGDMLAGGTSRLEARVPRRGTGRVVHNRFADDDPVFPDYADALSDEQSPESSDVGQIDAPVSVDAPAPSAPVASVVSVIMQALTPLAEPLLALSRYGPRYAPVVRVLSDAGTASLRVGQVSQALQRVGLGDLECTAVPASDGLMVVDAWLDAGEQRPLLVVGAQWADTPPPGSTEGAVAVLLGPGVFQLPAPVTELGLLHRPVTDELDALDAILANSVLWGETGSSSVASVWLSGLDSSHDTRLLAALRAAGLEGLTKREAQRWPDSVVGQAGAASGWLSVAAAFDVATGTHLILHAPSSTSIAQVAILHVNERINHEEANDERSQ